MKRSAFWRFDPTVVTVHDVLRMNKDAYDTLREYELDTCCGGDLPLSEAARRHGVDLHRLMAALHGWTVGSAVPREGTPT